MSLSIGKRWADVDDLLIDYFDLITWQASKTSMHAF